MNRTRFYEICRLLRTVRILDKFVNLVKENVDNNLYREYVRSNPDLRNYFALKIINKCT